MLAREFPQLQDRNDIVTTPEQARLTTPDAILRFAGFVVLLLAGYGLVQLAVTEHTLLPPATEPRESPREEHSAASPETVLHFQHAVDTEDLSNALAHRVLVSGGMLVRHAPADGEVLAQLPERAASELEWAADASWPDLERYLEASGAPGGGGDTRTMLLIVEPNMVRVLGWPVKWWALAIPGGLMCVVAAWFLGARLYDALPSRNVPPATPP